jgi:hypothetical protein
LFVWFQLYVGIQSSEWWNSPSLRVGRWISRSLSLRVPCITSLQKGASQSRGSLPGK